MAYLFYGRQRVDQVNLEFRSRAFEPLQNRVATWPGIMAECVYIEGPSELHYRFAGDNHYVALHDMAMTDGETRLDEVDPVRIFDLRDTLTFLPSGCGISGWSHLSNRRHNFIALHFQPALIRNELERDLSMNLKPQVYFYDRSTQATLRKLQTALIFEETPDDVYLETLALLAVLETRRYQDRCGKLHTPERGGLSASQERLVRDYIAENLSRRITLTDLASLVQLTRFHFARAFKKTFGYPPHQFMLGCRMDRAKQLLTDSKMPIGSVAACVGYANPVRFSAAFRRVSGHSPLNYRRSML